MQRRHLPIDSIGRVAGDTAIQYALCGRIPENASLLLKRIEDAMPAGEAVGDLSPAFALDCLICLDTSLRTLVDPKFRAGPAVEYALDPVVTTASERLFGVSQIGSGPDEHGRSIMLMNEPIVQRAFEEVNRAISALASQPVPDALLLYQLAECAAAMLPKESAR